MADYKNKANETEQTAFSDLSEATFIKIDEQGNIGPVIGKVLVYFRDILVGYVIDGLIVNTTGRSAAEWISILADYLRNFPACPTEIHISSSGRVHCGSGGTF